MANILILSNDAFRVKAKTCESLAAACRRLGHFAIVRDTADARFGLQAVEKSQQAEYRENLASKYLRLFDFFEFDTVIALDLDWLLLPDEFLRHPRIVKIISFWFDDLQTWLQGPVHESFISEKLRFEEILKHEKVLHCFYGRGQALEGELFGIQNQKLSPLAAAKELLDEKRLPEITNRLAFVGNPGCRQQPHPEIVKRIHEGADLEELRTLARMHILSCPPEEMREWMHEEPACKEFMEFATQVKVVQPLTPACEILKITAEGYAKGFDYLQSKNALLKACLLIKLVNQYERPAFIYRLYSKNLADVFSAQNEWKLYGVESRSFVSAIHLTEVYQRYLIHLNAPNPLRDAPGNEKLFELSACARTSLNLESPDVREYYSEEEVCFVSSLKELEAKAQELLAQTEKAIAMGINARRRTAETHTWDHRLVSVI